MVEFGGKAMHVADGGLNAELWGWSLLFGFGSLPIQQLINCFYGKSVAHRIDRSLASLKHSQYILFSPGHCEGVDGRVPTRLKSSRRLSTTRVH